MAEQRPDLILLIAPHAIALTNDFAVYTVSNASGTALIGGDLHNASTELVPFTVAVEGAPDLANNLVATLRVVNVTALLPWADSEPAPLRWSEVVPLWFMASVTNYSASPTRPGVIIWSLPEISRGQDPCDCPPPPHTRNTLCHILPKVRTMSPKASLWPLHSS